MKSRRGWTNVVPARIAAAGTSRLRLRMLAKRIIPCLDVNHGRVVKGTNFLNLKDAGDPVEVAARYDEEGADELVFLDITASHEDRAILLDVVRRTAEVCFMPLTVGGGIRSLDDIRTLLSAGADKVSINSAAVRDPELVRQAARRFGSQCIVVNIDPKRVERDGREVWEVHINGGRVPTGLRGGLLGARGRAAGRRRDRADQHGRRRDPERLRPGDDPGRGRRRRDPGGGLRRRGQPRAPARRPGRGGRQRRPGREHLPLPALFHRRDQGLPGEPGRARPARSTGEPARSASRASTEP